MHTIPTLKAGLAGAAMIAALACGGAAAGPAEAAPDTAAVRAVWATLDERWNDRDAVGFSEVFTEDVSFEFVDRGEALETRAVVREHFAARFPTFAPELRHLTTVRDVATMSEHIVAVDGKVEILREDPAGSAQPALLRTFAIFAIMTRESQSWRIRMIRIYQLPDTDAATARTVIAGSSPRPA